MKGFTLTELLLVVSIVIFIGALTLPVGIRFFRLQALEETASGIVAILRRAQAQAMFQKNDSSFGVKFFSDSYVLFQGPSYGLRTQGAEEDFPFSENIEVDGLEEIVFSKLTGLPDATGTLTVSTGSNNQTITINTQGRIDRD